MHDFDELLKTCRRRKLKRWVGSGVALVGVIGMVVTLQWYWNRCEVTPAKLTVKRDHTIASSGPKTASIRSETEKSLSKIQQVDTKQKRVKTSRLMNEHLTSAVSQVQPPVPQKSISKNKRVKYRVLQFAISQEKHREALQNLRHRLERFGLQCYIKSSIDRIHLYLRCNEPENFASLAPYLKNLHYSFFHVNEEGEKRPQPYRINLPTLSKNGMEIKKQRVKPPIGKPAQTEKIATASVSDTFVRMKKSKTVKLNVQKVESLDRLKARFERYPSYETALRIAQILYRRKDFVKAADWARKANALNRNKEGAWILFAKAEYAMGEKEKAKRILRIFLDYKSSKTAQALLGEWSRS